MCFDLTGDDCRDADLFSRILDTAPVETRRIVRAAASQGCHRSRLRAMTKLKHAIAGDMANIAALMYAERGQVLIIGFLDAEYSPILVQELGPALDKAPVGDAA